MSLPGCDTINWDSAQFDAGNIPLGVDVIKGSLLSISTNNDFPGTLLVTVTLSDSCVGTLGLSNKANPPVYDQTTYNFAAQSGITYYIPFRITGTICGDFACKLSYSVTMYPDTDNQITCTKDTTVIANVATCEWQTCLTKQTESVFCDIDKDCNLDICKDNCTKKLMKFIAIDSALRRAIYLEQWDKVSELYADGLSMCGCDCDGHSLGTQDFRKINIG